METVITLLTAVSCLFYLYFSVTSKPYRFSYGAVGNRNKVLEQGCTRRNSSVTDSRSTVPDNCHDV